MGGEPVVLQAVEDRVMTITLNRPEARNALSRAVR
jgi:enoyl-CoA hydratase